MKNSFKKNKPSHGMYFVFSTIVTVLVVVIIICLYTCYIEIEPYVRQDRRTNELITNAVHTESTNTSDSTLKKQKSENVVIDFSYLKNVNSDCIGYIDIPDTKVSYPIVKSKDNKDYLDKDFWGDTTKCGSIFMDCRSKSDFTSFNTVIYGHNMKDGSMFRTLNEYNSIDFYQAHPYVYLYLPNSEPRICNIVSAYITKPSDKIYTDFSSLTNDEQKQILSECVKNSLYATNTVYDSEKPVITLSTCRGSNNARFVLILQ